MRKHYICHVKVPGYRPFIQRQEGFNIYHSAQLNAIVSRAAQDLVLDLERVVAPQVQIVNRLEGDVALFILTLEDREAIASLNLDVAELEGCWEHYMMRTLVGESGQLSLVIVGSDPRGAVYGIYDLANEIGVSPWHWWLDVPIVQRDMLYVKEAWHVIDGPKVQYRGIFLNDEGPSLMTWARKYFGDFNHHFYEKVFELLLRLKANYIWPAMWDSTFYEDDEENIRTADRYGIVIGTSHHEPMNRPHGDWKKTNNGPWDYRSNPDFLREFWREGIERSKDYETIINLGMRGDGDEPLNREEAVAANKQLMEGIIADQREIIASVHDEASRSPQMWALYKEVKELYDAGLEVPDDVIMLWGDDNWGNIRRLPTIEESKRSGGAGIYYHFDYVGGPRSYKWIATVPIEKTWEQMSKAYHYQANKVWLVNVGDLKPMEYLIEFFLEIAWQPEQFNAENLSDYTRAFNQNIFKVAYHEEMDQVLATYLKFNGRVKPELLNAVDLYSWEADFEAERELAAFAQVVERSEAIYATLPLSYRDTYYQLIHYPALASYRVLKLQLLVNRQQQLAAINAEEALLVQKAAEREFLEDRLLSYKYNNTLSAGKWHHMMDQLHIGYTYWNQPDTLTMPAFSPRATTVGYPWLARIKNGASTHTLTHKIIYIDIWNTDRQAKNIRIQTEHPWLKVSHSQITLNTNARLAVSVAWEQLEARAKFESTVYLSDGQHEQKLTLTVDHRDHQVKAGFVPENNIVAIESASFETASQGDYNWVEIPNYGRTQSAMGLYPVQMAEIIAAEQAPYLTYSFNVFEDAPIKVKVFTAPSLPFWDGTSLSMEIQVDGDKQLAETGDLTQNGEQDSPDWEQAVMNNVHQFEASFTAITAGPHSLTIRPLNSQLIIQKIVIEQGVEDQTMLGQSQAPLYEELATYQPYEPQPLPDYVLIDGDSNHLDSSAQYVYLLNPGWYTWTQYPAVNLRTMTAADQVIKASSITGVYLEAGLYQVENPSLVAFDLTFIQAKSLNIDSQLAATVGHDSMEQRLDVIYYKENEGSQELAIGLSVYDKTGDLLKEWPKENYLIKEDFGHISQEIEANLSKDIATIIVHVEEATIAYQVEFTI